MNEKREIIIDLGYENDWGKRYRELYDALCPFIVSINVQYEGSV